MIEFLNILQETAAMHPDRPAVVDRDGTRTTTYRELFAAALRVNAWLRNHGIGREDVTAIYFPKSMEYIATRIGVMMSGGAWVGLEDIMGKDRIDFVIRDSRCKVVFNEGKWAEAMLLPPCEEIADPDRHDLAFIIYTSGSTGTPKGTAQEYGVYANILKGTSVFMGPARYPEPMNFAEVAPQTFVAGVYTTVGVLGLRGTIHEISPGMVRNMEALTGYFIGKEIHHTFMTPTFIKLLLRDPRIRLRAASTGGEIVSDVYTDRFEIYNVYGPSEFGFPTCVFRLDKAYENSPIGCPACRSDIVLLDEEGHPSDEGAFSIRLPYFRGYVGGTDDSCFARIDGKDYFRTSDFVRRDEKGRYIVLDRLDDMIKLNGNRVDTREVEGAVKRALGVEFCCVRLYRINGIKALCAYYSGDSEIDSVSAAGTLRDYVPEYMIPSTYIRLQEIPLNANGKLDKRALPEPKGTLRIRPFAAPEDALQKKICDVLKSVLETENEVGIDDDFFMLGGDSIRAMEALACCEIPGLTVQMIYEGRTVREIVSLLHAAEQASEVIPDKPDTAPLNVGQRYLLKEDQKHPGTCMLNLPIRFSVSPDADLEKLAAAIRTAVKAHPALMSVIEEQDGDYFLRYRPETDISFPVEKMTDEEMEAAAAIFVRPFRLNGERLFRCRLIRGESKGTVLMDVYHVICDGFSLEKLLADIGRALSGGKIAPDWCYFLLREEAANRDSLQFRRDMAYFSDLYDRPGWDTVPKPDHDTDEDTDDKVFQPFGFEPKDVTGLERKYGFGKGGLYIAAAALAIAACNDSEDIMFTWTWHGRADRKRMDSVGYFSKDLPIAVHLKRGLLLSRLYEEISRQVRNGISHGSVSYWEEKGSYEGKDLVCFLYQGGVYEYHGGEGIFIGLETLPSPQAACNNTLDIEILDGEDEFGVLLDYNARKYERTTIERFGRIFRGLCRQLISVNPNTTRAGDVIRKAVQGEEA